MATAPPASVSRAPLALIVIEDSSDDYELVVARVRAAFGPVRAVRVETRVELAAALAEGGWSAVLADHRLPSFSSIAALELTRELAPDLPFIIVSGEIGEDAAVDALHAGADDYVMKDRLGRLAPAIAHALAAARLRQQRHEAEAALVESEARFRSLAANLPGMVFQIEVDGGRLTPVYAGEGARRLFGLSAAELAGNPGGWMERLPPAAVDTLRARLVVATAGVTAFDWDDDTHAGQPRWIEHVVELPADVDDRIPARHLEFKARARRVGPTRVRWDGIATDITRQKEAESELTRSREELRELASHLEQVRDAERASIARELHDDVGSTLTGVKFQLKWLKGQLGSESRLAPKLAELDALVDSAITASTRIMHDLRPAILDQGIVAALEWQARAFEARTGLACRFRASAEEVALAPAQAIALFRVCQEALNNVAKHARASVVEVSLEAAADTVALEIRDDGRGITRADTAKRGHFGLIGMQERALALGGRITVTTRDDRPGTAIRLTLPADAPAPAASGRGDA
jgi:signal transduction histidine kinase